MVNGPCNTWSADYQCWKGEVGIAWSWYRGTRYTGTIPGTLVQGTLVSGTLVPDVLYCHYCGMILWWLEYPGTFDHLMTSLQARFDQLMTGAGRAGREDQRGGKTGTIQTSLLSFSHTTSWHPYWWYPFQKLFKNFSKTGTIQPSLLSFSHTTPWRPCSWWFSFQWNGWHSSNTWSLSYCNYCLIRRKWSLLASPQQIWNTINFSCHRRRHCCNHFDQCWIGCFVVIIWSAIDSGANFIKKCYWGYFVPSWQIIVWSD